MAEDGSKTPGICRYIKHSPLNLFTFMLCRFPNCNSFSVSTAPREFQTPITTNQKMSKNKKKKIKKKLKKQALLLEQQMQQLQEIDEPQEGIVQSK